MDIGPTISVRGARENNLRNIDVDLPRNRLVAVTGISGSGKSSLVFDTVFAEAQRQFLDSLSSYARLSLPRISPPDVDVITGLSPAIVINQRPIARNPRSTVGTATEAYTFLRLLFSRLGGKNLDARDFSFNTPAGACPQCKGLGTLLTPELEALIDFDRSIAEGAIQHRTWKVGSRYWNITAATGLFDMDKPIKRFSRSKLDLLLYSEPRVQANTEPGYVQRFSFEGVVHRLQKRIADKRGQASSTYDLSFFRSESCSECGGSRLNKRARSVRLKGRALPKLVTMEIYELRDFFAGFDDSRAGLALPFIQRILNDLVELGAGYLTLSRSVATLSGGEAQRVKLARQLGSHLTEMIYIFDEPTSGLHSRDTDRLLAVLRALTGRPNTVIVVEHDRDFIEASEYVIDLGPGGGTEGGRVVAVGSPDDLCRSDSATGRFLREGSHTPVRRVRRTAARSLVVANARRNNLTGITVEIPCETMTCITGVSGSGKSSLASEFLRQHSSASVVDQSTPGSNPRSNALTYLKIFDVVRKLFAKTAGVSPSLFTFNGAGACQTCKGLGNIDIDMHFLGSIRQVCADCGGKRFNKSALRYRLRGKTIAEVLDLTVDASMEFFDTETVRRPLGLLVEFGLGYLRLGQSLDTLSGGEAQRLKLATRLQRSSEVYLLDEPTRGLHFSDVNRLVHLLNTLINNGNTVVVIEHNLDLIVQADWVIDLGPEGGDNGGRVVAVGPPEVVAGVSDSQTGICLARRLKEASFSS